jgi:DNA topoisomerase-1
VRGPHREHVGAKQEPTPKTHPKLFFADGERKWKVPPQGAKVETNTAQNGTWRERWKPAPKSKDQLEASFDRWFKKLSEGTLRQPKPRAEAKRDFLAQEKLRNEKYTYNYPLSEVRRRAGVKFTENREMGTKLPQIRAKVSADLGGPNSANHQVAMAVRLIDKAFVRVGGEGSVDDHVGVMTLKKSQVKVQGDTVVLNFIGKSGVEWVDVEIKDKQLAKAVTAQLGRVKGGDTELFQFDGKDLKDHHVNAYLEDFGVTAKMFRTFHATRMAREELLQHTGAPRAEREAIIEAMFEKVAKKMHHEKPSMTRKHYVDPMIITAFERGALK